MRKAFRNRKGQSMVEYAIGIGAVTAVCMLVLGGLGKSGFDIMNAVLTNINDKDDQTTDPTNGIFTNGVGGTNSPPWSLK